MKEMVIFGFMMLVVSLMVNLIRKPQLETDQIPLQLLLDSSFIDQTHLQPDDLTDKPVLIYLWGTWCSVCRFMSPTIEALSQRSSEYEVISVAFNSGSHASLRQYMSTQGYTFPIINEDHHQWRSFVNMSVFPTFLLYNRAGILTFTEVGYTTYWGLVARLIYLKFFE